MLHDACARFMQVGLLWSTCSASPNLQHSRMDAVRVMLVLSHLQAEAVGFQVGFGEAQLLGAGQRHKELDQLPDLLHGTMRQQALTIGMVN